MLESREVYDNYFPSIEGENKGWRVTLIINGVNRGCSGFDTKKKALKWTESQKSEMEKYFGKTELLEITKMG